MPLGVGNSEYAGNHSTFRSGKLITEPIEGKVLKQKD